MAEIVRTTGSSLLWLAVFTLFLVASNLRGGRTRLDHRGLLVAFPAFYGFQILAVKVLSAMGFLNPLGLVATYLVAGLFAHRTHSLSAAAGQRRGLGTAVLARRHTGEVLRIGHVRHRRCDRQRLPNSTVVC